MNSDYRPELTERAAGELEKLFPALEQKLAAKRKVEKALDEMVAEDKVLILNDDEEAMIRAYRRWRVRQTKNGATFRWQISFNEAEIEVVQETGFIAHPNEAESDMGRDRR